MPAEIHRLRRPVAARDRRLIAAIGLASALIVVATLLVTSASSPALQPGCVKYDQPGVMGGGTWRLCGSAAVTYCRQHAARIARLVDQCASIHHRVPGG